jgi:tRNA (guanine-N7-)-methyltransferase
VTPALVLELQRVLAPGGELRVASDVEEYFKLIQHLVAAHPYFQERPPAVPREPDHTLDYLTNFERKYRLEGRSIYRAVYQWGQRG